MVICFLLYQEVNYLPHIAATMTWAVSHCLPDHNEMKSSEIIWNKSEILWK